MKYKFLAIKGKVLGVDVYRGFGKLSEVASISAADIYDSKDNPTGTQRDLSPKHAREAYYYVKNNELAFWPEVFLCVRNMKCIKFISESKESKFGIIEIDSNAIRDYKGISISRVDGNHRLHFASGENKDFPPLENEVSFCIAFDISIDQEITLFRDINNNQKRMNTSHLDNIELRLSPEEEIKRKDVPLYIAKCLSKDANSPLYEKVYEGGRNLGPNMIPLRTLKTGIQYMLSRTIKLTSFKDPDAEYRVVRNFFEAVKIWQPEAWKSPSQYLLLRGVGLWGICFIGANVIDRGLSKGKFDVNSLVQILRSGRSWDWSRKGSFEGLSGRGGASKISEMVTSELNDDTGFSVKDLYQQIMKD